MDELSPAQRRIVMQPATYQHALILAGPGSGKTRTITERIAYLISEQQVAPEQILVMTFSNKAARDLELRLSDRLTAGCHGLWADTFHSIGARLLRTHVTAIHVPPTFRSATSSGSVFPGPSRPTAGPNNSRRFSNLYQKI